MYALVENYAQKNRSQNWLWFFWPAWYVVAKWLHFFHFHFAIEILMNFGGCNIPLQISFQQYITRPQIHKNLVAKPKKKMQLLNDCSSS